MILTLRNALGLTVFLVTHDLDTLYTICDRVAVLANQKVLINDGIEAVERFKHPWIQEYFHGPVAVRPPEPLVLPAKRRSHETLPHLHHSSVAHALGWAHAIFTL